jgi:DNA-binding NtrC family response regulator
LLVDDDHHVLSVLGRTLVEDLDVLLSSSVPDAMGLIATEKLDAIITDLDLDDTKGRDGLWLLEQARTHCPRAHRILMSGLPRDVDAHLRSGLLDVFLTKPFAAATISALVVAGADHAQNTSLSS